MSSWVIHVAEVLLALVCVLGGLSTLRRPQTRADQLARFRLPFANLLVRLNAAVMVVAGSALALNIAPGLASAVLALVLVPTTVFGHAFWVAEASLGRNSWLISSRTSPCSAVSSRWLSPFADIESGR